MKPIVPVIVNSLGNFYQQGNLDFRAERTRNLGFGTVEMTMYDVAREGIDKCAEVVREFGFEVSDLHASVKVPADTRPHDYKSELLRVIDVAKALGIRVVTFHPAMYENDIDLAKTRFIEIMKEVLGTAAREGVELVVENIVVWDERVAAAGTKPIGMKPMDMKVKYIISSEKEVEWVLSELPVRLLYDINHGHQHSHDIYEMVKKNKDKLFGLHVGDAHFGIVGIEHEHLPFGKGDIDFPRLCGIVKDANVFLIIELIRHGSFEDLKTFKEKLEELLSK